ncbi:hypothetical protein [Rhodococcus sovatensis]|uniref:Uncharacterized protein n=1 Tax=Rhodococcus sovatensis TaxID=1805840 RepID=A0ABZ2PI34_9NOCA
MRSSPTAQTETLLGTLTEAGHFVIVWGAADYRFALRDGRGGGFTYIEGDLVRGTSRLSTRPGAALNGTGAANPHHLEVTPLMPAQAWVALIVGVALTVRQRIVADKRAQAWLQVVHWTRVQRESLRRSGGAVGTQ